MSPRAAWRLETLGFGDVYDYVDGKNDWMAAGLPTEGTNAEHPRAVDVVRKDVPTCALKEKLGDVKSRVRAQGWYAVVVANDQRVRLRLLRSNALDKDPEILIAAAMVPGTAFVEGQRLSAPATNLSASGRSWIEGSLTSSSAVRPKRFSIGPMPTRVVLNESATPEMFLRRAMLIIAF